MALRSNLRKIRLDRNMSSRKLSEKSGVARSHIQKIERNETNPSLKIMLRLAKALDVNLYDLIEIEED